MIGSTLHQRYRIEAELGRGGLGVVYRGQDLLLGRKVAVKVVATGGMEQEGRLRLLHEAQATAQLNHPNIVSVYDAGEEDGNFYLVRELIDGHSLEEQPPQSIVETLAYTRQICAALAHAHAHGIVHRDLKPGNVMRLSGGTAGNQVKLVDFGLARSIASRVTQEGSLVGTVFYMAPEQALGQEIDGRADLYSLGVMLFEFFANRLPFSAEDPLAVITQHLYAPPVPPSTFNPEVTPDLDRLVLQLLSKQREARPANAEEVLEFLESAATAGARRVTDDPLALLGRMVRGRLVGRETELGLAEAAWRKASTGESLAFLLSGEPGIGKTRLLRELIARVDVQGGRILQGECFAAGGGPYAPLSGIIQDGVDLLDEGGIPQTMLADLVQVSPGLRLRFANIPPNPPLEARLEQRRMQDSIVDLFGSLAAQKPLLLAVEDAHWADSASMQLIHYLLRYARREHMKLMVVLTYREIELEEGGPLFDLLYELQREGLSERVKLNRFDYEQTGELLRVLLAEEITPEFLDGIYRETEGNPFFTEEVCKTLIEQGTLYREGSKWERPAMKEVAVPQSIRLAIQARMARLPEAVQEVMRTAAIIGREFAFDLLFEVSGKDELELISILESGLRAQLVNELPAKVSDRKGSVRFSFAHALIPAILEEQMSEIRRQKMNFRVAKALEEGAPDRLDESAVRLARHFFAAGEWERAADYWSRAGDQARHLFAFQEALECYQQALQILVEIGSAAWERSARLAMKLASLHYTLLDYQAASQVYAQAFELWAKVGSRPRQSAGGEINQVLSLPYRASISTLDPCMILDSDSANIIRHLFCGLVEQTPEMDVMPGLAHSWEIQDGGKRYIFHLRDDYRWSDGVRVTASDVEYAWKRMLMPENASDGVAYLSNLRGADAYFNQHEGSLNDVGVKALDDFTLEVELDEASGIFLYVISSVQMFPVPRHRVEQLGGEWATPENLVSNGPYKLVSWVRNVSLILEHNPEYRGYFPGNLKQVSLTLIENYSMEYILEEYRSNTFDTVFVSQMGKLRKQEISDDLKILDARSCYFIGFNTAHPLFQDRRIRRAFAHAIDKYRISDQVGSPYVLPGTGGFVPPDVPGHSPEIGLDFNLPLARTLLAEAGFLDGLNFPQVSLQCGRGRFISIPEFVKDQLVQNLDIPVQVEEYDWVELINKIKTENSGMFSISWAGDDYPDADSFLRICIQLILSRWHNDEYAELIKSASQATDPLERIKYYQAADRLLIQEAVVIPLGYFTNPRLVKPWVHIPGKIAPELGYKYIVVDPH